MTYEIPSDSDNDTAIESATLDEEASKQEVCDLAGKEVVYQEHIRIFGCGNHT